MYILLAQHRMDTELRTSLFRICRTQHAVHEHARPQLQVSYRKTRKQHHCSAHPQASTEYCRREQTFLDHHRGQNMIVHVAFFFSFLERVVFVFDDFFGH